MAHQKRLSGLTKKSKQSFEKVKSAIKSTLRLPTLLFSLEKLKFGGQVQSSFHALEIWKAALFQNI